MKIQTPEKIGKFLRQRQDQRVPFVIYLIFMPSYNSFEKMPDFHGLFQAASLNRFEVPSPWFCFTMKTPNLSVKISAHLTSEERKMDLQFSAAFVMVRVSTLLESLKYHANCPAIWVHFFDVRYFNIFFSNVYKHETSASDSLSPNFRIVSA